jgi:hypothetical protein
LEEREEVGEVAVGMADGVEGRRQGAGGSGLGGTDLSPSYVLHQVQMIWP